jgi:hypothetical protein
VWQQCEAAAAPAPAGAAAGAAAGATGPAVAEQGLVNNLPPLPEVPGETWGSFRSWVRRPGVASGSRRGLRRHS